VSSESDSDSDGVDGEEALALELESVEMRSGEGCKSATEAATGRNSLEEVAVFVAAVECVGTLALVEELEQVDPVGASNPSEGRRLSLNC